MRHELNHLAEMGKDLFKKYPYTAYSNELRLDDEVAALFGYVSTIRDLSNDVVDNVNLFGDLIDSFLVEYDDNLSEAVKKTLSEWQTSGTLNKIINEAFQNQIDDLEKYTEKEVEKIGVVLNNKAEKTTVWGLESLSQEVKTTMTGGSVAIVGENSVNNTTIVDGQVFNEKTTLVKPTRNMFNKRTAKPNLIIGGQTGTIVAGDRWVSEKIKVEQNTPYIKNASNNSKIALYDFSDAFISSITANSFTTTGNTSYIRIDTINPDGFQLEKGTVTTEYIDYYSDLSETINVYDVNMNVSEYGSLNIPIEITTNPLRITIAHNVSVFTNKERIRVPSTNTEKYVFDITPENDNWIILFDKKARDFTVKQYSNLVGTFNTQSQVVIGVLYASQLIFSSMTPYYIDGNYMGIAPVEQTGNVAYNPVRPKQITWGNEYLYSYYKKLLNKSPIKMVWAGDSTTNQETSVADPAFRRNALGKKLLVKGGYNETSVTSLNHGHGGATTLDWIDNWLDVDMAENPDIYLLGYGLNDGGSNYFAGTVEQRLSGFETRLRQGLTKIRTTMGLTPDKLAIIISTPVATNDPTNGRTPENWNNLVVPIIQKACRDFQCAFVDINAYQYDRKFSNAWSNNGDNVHPDWISTLDYMGIYKPLLMPLLMEQ